MEVAVDTVGRLVALRFVDGDHERHPGARWPLVAGQSTEGEGVARRIAEQLEGYFAGTRRDFDLPVTPASSPFAAAVRRAIVAIPYGEVRTYSSIATSLGRPSAARAVGRASALNPLPVVVPCHRLVGSDGGLRGYAGGPHLKRWLLEHEGHVVRPMADGGPGDVATHPPPDTRRPVSSRKRAGGCSSR